ncbi:K(+) efflux antiporter 2, chloroplastic-like protein [Corchorus olitorius]|uniref:K(+) efflux antiporter 2, chloroplastic-like protein n=1 Tax=Corchorus olitorius TaxID=93759 RepID=A0A1R3K053_9ROSI|nr:K(+) efflux antiporter 2, chloroplastic-like protein [Corchorus olitorius]
MDFVSSLKFTAFHSGEVSSSRILDPLCPRFRCSSFSDLSDHENGLLGVNSTKEVEAEKSENVQRKNPETQILFDICLELFVERLSFMKRCVFGLGSAQVLVTAVAFGLVSHFVVGQPGPAAIVIENGLAFFSTVVVLQVVQEQGDSTLHHGCDTFSVLLFQSG